MIEGLWSLPGPARHAASVGEALRGGGSCAVVAPEPLRSDEHWVFGAAEAADVGVEHIPIDPGRPPGAVFAEFCGLPCAAGPDRVSALARHEVFAGRIVSVSLPAHHSEWAAFVAAFLTALPAIPEIERPQLLVFCSADDLAVLRRQRLALTERWWWGSVGRLDTTVAAVGALGDQVDPVALACITEVCGFDLGFVEVLAREWDGSLDRLLALVEEGARQEATLQERSSLASWTSSASPPIKFRADWEQGLVNAWGRYEPFVSPTAVPKQLRAEVLRTRVWRGQLRELMPLVDEERARLEAWVKSGRVAERDIDYPIEIGYLLRLLRVDPDLKRRASPVRMRAATWLRDTRNALAHRDIMTPQEISEGRGLLDEDRRAT